MSPQKPQPPSKLLQRSASLAKDFAPAPVQADATRVQAVRPLPLQPLPTGPGRRVSIFFDGTGNNLTADTANSGDEEHSNVARLYRAHLARDPAQGLYPIYVPGIGTYFKEVHDEGGTKAGNASGAKGDARLDWAMNQLDQAIAGTRDTVHVALFGFSRGAALARAFARRLAKRCESRGGLWFLKEPRRPIRLYFMGLFDTVASVGLAASTRTSAVYALADLRAGLFKRSIGRASLPMIAVGDEPGVDPSPGFFDGHASWASNLRIPSMVERCVHMVAAHEIRNSFPLESLLDGASYPPRCEELVFPGVHSDVGGGYRPKEGGRGKDPGSMLSLIPLRRMFQKAVQSGVPLEQRTAEQKKDFALDAINAASYQAMEARYWNYLKLAGNGGKSLGQSFLSHMKLYYQWRFRKLALDLKARANKKRTSDEQKLLAAGQKWSKEREALNEEADKLWEQYTELARKAMPVMIHGMPMPRTATQEKFHQAAQKKEDEYRKVKARLDTLPGKVSDLIENMQIYDQQLYVDALILQELAARKKKLLPHYQAILDAFVAEFEKKNGLKDAEIIAFFDEYVHDSLAPFGLDSTLPSDPRIVYIGGDEELKYGGTSSGPAKAVNNS